METSHEAGHIGHMPNELRVGIMFLIGMILLLMLIMSLTHFGQERNTYRVVIQFQRADGMSEGAAVRLAGVDVGRVCGVGLDPDTKLAQVTISVIRDVILWHEYTYTIGTSGLVGERFIEITPKELVTEEDLAKRKDHTLRENETMTRNFVAIRGVKNKDSKWEPDTVKGKTRADLNDAMDKAAELVEKTTLTIDSFNNVITKKETQENIKIAIANFRAVSQKLDVLIARNQAGITSIVANLQDVAGDIRRVSDTISPQIEKTTLFANAEIAMKNAVKISEKLEVISTALSCTLCDEQLNANVKQTICNLKDASDDLKVVLANAKTVSANLPKISDNLTIASADLPKITANVQKASDDLPKITANVNKATADLPEITTNLKAASADLPKITGPIREIAPETAKNIHEISVRLRDASASIGGIAQQASKLCGAVTETHIGPVVRVVGFSDGERTIRSDVNMDIRMKSLMLRAGVADLGGKAPVNLQLGNKWGDSTWLRYGVVQSQLGVGLDYQISPGASFTGELFDPNELRGNALFDLRLKALGPGWWFTTGAYDLFGNDSRFGVGLTYRP